MNAPLPIVVILTLSILIQTAAAIMAVRLIYITGRRLAWILIAVALTLMAARRVLPLYRLIMGDVSLPPDPLNEVVGLVLSTAMAAGIARIAPLFLERKKAAEGFRLLIENSPISIAISDASWDLEFLNRKFIETFGYTLEDCPHIDSWWTLAYPDPAYREQVKAEWFSKVGEAEAQGKEISPQETVVTCKDGSTKNIEFRHIAIQDRGITLFYDITERTQVEEKLKLGNSYNRSLIEASLDPLVTIDAGGKITDVNSSAESVTGYDREKLIGTDFSDYFTAPDKAREGYQRVFRKGTVRDYALEIKHRDGRITPVLYNASIYKNEAGKIIGVFAAARDITERKKAEEALHKREAELNESQRVAHIGSWDWDAVKDAIWWSDEYYRIYGFDPKQPALNYMEHLKAYTPESAERLDAAVKRTMESGEPYETDLELARPTASTRWIVARGEAKHDASGQICGLRGTAQNITERKRDEEELKRLTQRNELILNSAGEGIFGTDTDGNITFINLAARNLLGFRSEELIGKNSHKLFHHTKADGKPYPVEECPLHKSLNEGESHRGQNEIFWTRDGGMVSVEHVNTPLIEHDEVVGAVVVFRDIAARKRVEEEIRTLNEDLEKRVRERTTDLHNKSAELQESQMALINIVDDLNSKTEELERVNARLKELDRLKSMFIASMSHELRTPLNSVIGFSSILLNEWIGPVNAEQKENLAAILRSGKHLLNLINDVIDVSKIEAGKVEPHAEEFDLHDLMSEAIGLVEADARNKGIALALDIRHKQMRTDRRRLLQCVINLLSNAVKFTEKGRITVQTCIISGETEQEHVEISVEDTGIGIRAEDFSKLFQPFVRLVSPIQATIVGTGLGLYLSNKLTSELLKGDIICMSTYEKGSRFTIRIPVSIV